MISPSVTKDFVKCAIGRLRPAVRRRHRCVSTGSVKSVTRRLRRGAAARGLFVYKPPKILAAKSVRPIESVRVSAMKTDQDTVILIQVGAEPVPRYRMVSLRRGVQAIARPKTARRSDHTAFTAKMGVWSVTLTRALWSGTHAKAIGPCASMAIVRPAKPMNSVRHGRVIPIITASMVAARCVLGGGGGCDSPTLNRCADDPLRCVQCLRDDHCATGACDPGSGQCVCRTSDDCNDLSRPLCAPDVAGQAVGTLCQPCSKNDCENDACATATVCQACAGDEGGRAWCRAWRGPRQRRWCTHGGGWPSAGTIVWL